MIDAKDSPIIHCRVLLEKKNRTKKDNVLLERYAAGCTQHIIQGRYPKSQAEMVVQALNVLIKEGDATGVALYNLGLLTYHGYGTSRDLKKSYEYHRQSADKSNADAMFELYVLLSTGQGVEKNEQEALEWCTKAAELNQPRACYNMGSFYASGNGVNRDNNKAIEWYERASQQGHGRATATIGMMYFSGQGVPPNIQIAATYMAKAEQQGFNVKKFLDALGMKQ